MVKRRDRLVFLVGFFRQPIELLRFIVSAIHRLGLEKDWSESQYFSFGEEREAIMNPSGMIKVYEKKICA